MTAMREAGVGMFALEAEVLYVCRGPSGWSVSLSGRETHARFLDAALESVLGRRPDLRLVLEILQWDAAPSVLH